MSPPSCSKQSPWRYTLTIFIALTFFDTRPCIAWVPTAMRQLQQASFSATPVQSGGAWALSTPTFSCSRAMSALYATSDDSTPSNDSNDDDKNGENSNNLDPDSAFYREYQKAKLDKLGWDIPPEQARACAESAESEFLQAMQQCESEFEEAKKEDDGDTLSAADFFWDKIKKEEALEELWSKEREGTEEEGADSQNDEGSFQ